MPEVNPTNLAPKLDLTDWVERLKQNYSQLEFRPSDKFYWSPQDRVIYYSLEESSKSDKEKIWTLLHETAHALLEHQDFGSDFELILLESQAWQKTVQLSNFFGAEEIDEDFIQDCIDTYRNWQYRRSKCPNCSSGGIQVNRQEYHCVGCMRYWRVSRQRFCRVYRNSKTKN